jgi:hypothetical protein
MQNELDILPVINRKLKQGNYGLPRGNSPPPSKVQFGSLRRTSVRTSNEHETSKSRFFRGKFTPGPVASPRTAHLETKLSLRELSRGEVRWTKRGSAPITEHRLGLPIHLARLRRGFHRWALAPEFVLILPRSGLKTTPSHKVDRDNLFCRWHLESNSGELARTSQERQQGVDGCVSDGYGE